MRKELLLSLKFLTLIKAQIDLCWDEIEIPSESGFSADKTPPFLINEQISLHCPGAKKYEDGAGKWSGKAALTCNADLRYEKSFEVWPFCECHHDLSDSRCETASYSTVYGGSRPSTTLFYPVPPEAEKWSLSVTMDANIKVLNVEVTGAEMSLKGERTLQLRGEGKDRKTAEIIISYNIPVITCSVSKFSSRCNVRKSFITFYLQRQCRSTSDESCCCGYKVPKTSLKAFID